jgi:hypothetical protein
MRSAGNWGATMGVGRPTFSRPHLLKELTVVTYLVAFARIQSDKDSDIALQGVYFGGVGETPEEAERIARECVNTIKGGTILPKIIQLSDTNSVIDGLLDAMEKFEQVAAYMVEADNTYKRSMKR